MRENNDRPFQGEMLRSVETLVRLDFENPVLLATFMQTADEPKKKKKNKKERSGQLSAA